MNKLKAIFIYFVLTIFFAVGQKQELPNLSQDAYSETFAKLHYWNYKLSSAQDTNVIKSIIKSEFNFTEEDNIVVTHIATSLTATHITFQQYFKGKEVFGGSVKVAISNNNVLFRCIETLFTTSGNIAAVPTFFNVAENLPEFANLNLLKNKGVYLVDGNRLQPGWYASFLVEENRYFEAAWFADGNRYFLHDLLLYAKDSLATLKVFSPDPITPVGKVYGGVYIDDNDRNESVLNPLRQTVTANLTFENDTFFLKSSHVQIAEFSNPVNPIAFSLDPIMDFSRFDYQFEQVNAFYHITAFQNYLQSLGYNLVNYPIRVDAQGWNGQDNSAFQPASQPLPSLIFGEGGVDDAEDADVVVHEYGHAVSHSASPYSNLGNERRTLEEAVGDYFAVSYKKMEYSFGSDLVFNWDGHNVFFTGRTVNNPSNYNYKTITNFSNIYKYTTLWNDAMFDIWNQLGKAYTDRLQIEALYGYANNLSFSQAALLVIDADNLMSSGANAVVIWRAFDQRGILDWSLVSENRSELKPYVLKNTFCNQSNLAQIDINSDGFYAELFDVNGKRVSAQLLYSGKNEIYLNAAPSGMYILLLKKDGVFYREKIVVTN